MITDEDKERVRQATDIVALVGETVELKQRGREFWGCCPFHHEKSPSFKVNPDTGLWHCFGCGKGGDVFSYVQERENLEFPDAIRYLADRAGIELTEERGVRRGPKRNRLIACLTEAESFYQTMLLRGKGEGPAAGRSYLGGRGFGTDVCRRWHLGYAPGHGMLVAHLRQAGFTTEEMVKADLARERDGRVYDRFFERVMFPIHDEQGRTIAFGGRILQAAKHDGIAKYINTGDTPVFNKRKHLFAFDRAKDGMVTTGEAIVCEGYTDVIALHEAGFTNAVAALGTAFSLDHVKAIERLRVRRIICMFDGDAAGQRAAERTIQYLDKTSAELLCVVLPDNQDPMEFLAAHGADALRPYLEGARPLLDFVFQKRLAGYDLSVPGQRVEALDNLAGLLAPLKDSPLLDGYAVQLADTLGMDVDRTKALIRSKPVASDRDEGRRAPAADQPPYDDVAREPEPMDVGALSADDRRQIVAERELLAQMAAHPDDARAYAGRIAGFDWADGRHQAIAWAMLATPEGTSPADVVDAATAVEPQAPRLLSGGRLAETVQMTPEQALSFLMDTVELYSTRRRIRTLKARLRGAQAQDLAGDEATQVFREATELQRHANELSARLSASAD